MTGIGVSKGGGQHPRAQYWRSGCRFCGSLIQYIGGGSGTGCASSHPLRGRLET